MSRRNPIGDLKIGKVEMHSEPRCHEQKGVDDIPSKHFDTNCRTFNSNSPFQSEKIKQSEKGIDTLFTMRRGSIMRERSRMIRHSRPDPDEELEMKFSEDSSVFSGLVEQENEMNDLNRLREPEEMRLPPKGILRTSKHTGPAKYVVVENGSTRREGMELYSRSGSSLTERSKSQRTKLREMRPIVDAELESTISGQSSLRRNVNYDFDGDTNTEMTWGEANNTGRAQGSIRLVSAVKFLGEDSMSHEEDNMNIPAINKSESNESSDSRIVELLDDFERQMDENLQFLTEDNEEEESNILTDFNKNILSKTTDLTSQGPQLGEFLDPHQAKKLQRILQKARKDVEVLRDDNEQYRSELEQMEEEHKSEIKLVEDRAKHKLVELKNMYQNEIDLLVQEKDAAIVEAGRIAGRYAESGRKQVSTLKKQIDKLKAAAAITIREKVKEQREFTATNKDKEILEKVEMLQKSHKRDLDKLKEEYDERLKQEVDKAASSVAKRVRLNQDVLISELTTQIDDFKKQHHSLSEVLESVKSKFSKNYPEQMKAFNKASPESAESLTKKSNFDCQVVERSLMEVIETYTYLMEDAETKALLAMEQRTIEEKNEENQRNLEIQHRVEIDNLRREIEEKDEKMRKLENDFKALSREKCLLGEKFQKESEGHKQELERMSAQKETLMSIEQSRKDLRSAMAEGQKELVYAKEREEKVQPLANALSSVPSLESPLYASSTDNQLALRPNHQRNSFDMPPSPRVHSSIEKARNFQKRHPRRFLRHTSPRNRLVGNCSPQQTKESFDDDSKKLPITAAQNFKSSEIGSVMSNYSIQNNGTSSLVHNQMKEVHEDELDIRNSMPDSTSKSISSFDKSIKSKDSILLNFRKPSYESNIDDEVQSEEQEEKDWADITTEGDMEISIVESDSISRRRLSALIPEKIQNTLQPIEDSDNHQRARMFRQFIEQDRQEDSTIHSGRLSLDNSISSLQTNNGAMNKRFNILNSRPYNSSTVAYSEDDSIVQNISHEESTSSERGTNTLGMFLNAKKVKEFVTDAKKGNSMNNLAREVATQTREEKDTQFAYGKGESLREQSTHLNFKKTPISVDSSIRSSDMSGKKDNFPTDVFNGKKGDPPSSVPSSRKAAMRIDSFDSMTEKSVPSSIAVNPNVNRNMTDVANGHTLLCKPLSVHQSKLYSQATVSNLTGEASEDDELVYESHAQMRKLPPLTDNMDDEESGVCTRDKYQSVGSRSLEEYFRHNDETHANTVDAKKSTYRRSGLAAFRPSQSFEGSSTINTSETNSNTGSSTSDATTTITAHTRKPISFRGISPKRSKNNTSKYIDASNGSKRFAALKARVRVRKV